MQWDAFVKPDFAAGRWAHDEHAHALATPGKSIVAKSVSYVWRATSQPALLIREGVYELVFHFWDNTRPTSRSETHTVAISSTEIEQLSDRANPPNPRAASVQLNQQLQPNLFLNEFEHTTLIGKPLRSLT